MKKSVILSFVRSIPCPTALPSRQQGQRTGEDPASQSPQLYSAQIDGGREESCMIIVLGMGCLWSYFSKLSDKGTGRTQPRYIPRSQPPARWVFKKILNCHFLMGLGISYVAHTTHCTNPLFL
jgi:hypothetical protein